MGVGNQEFDWGPIKLALPTIHHPSGETELLLMVEDYTAVRDTTHICSHVLSVYLF